jgi:peptidylprolyl isomerase
VVVNYTGWTTDGTIVDGAPVGGPAVTFTLAETMPGWQEGLRLMGRGDKFRFWIPATLAYAGAPGKPKGMLVYDIYLVDFSD